MTATRTTMQRLLDLALGDAGPLDEFVRSRRAKGRGWRRIALDLYDLTGEEVTYESLRNWYGKAAQS